MKKTYLIIVGLVLVLLAIPSGGKTDASTCSSVIQPQYATNYTQPIIEIPLYQFVYEPYVATPKAADIEQIRQMIKAEMELQRKQDERIDNTLTLKENDDGPPMALNSPVIVLEIAKPSQDNYALNILKANCQSCHTGAGSKGGFMMFTDKDNFNPEASKTDIWNVTDLGTMPPKNTNRKLNQEQVASLRQWMLQKKGQ